MCYKFLIAPVFLVAAVAGAPYDVQDTAPERLVQPQHHGNSVQCGVQYVTIWDTDYVEQVSTAHMQKPV